MTSAKRVLKENPGIDITSPEFMDKLFTLDPWQARDLFYERRNEKLLKMVKEQKFNTVVELAGASGLLAEMFLAQHPEVETYLHTDYSVVACQLALGNLRGYHRHIYERVFDVCKDLDTLNWNAYDLLISTSLEHFPKGTDIQILNRLKSGTHILWSFCKVEVQIPTHLHPYKSVDYVRKRFQERIKILKLGEFETVVLLNGIKK